MALKYSELRARADTHSRAVMARIRRIAHEAGIDSSIPLLHANNALVSAHYGQPWRGVDYSKVRLIRHLEREWLFAAYRVLDRISARDGWDWSS